LISLEAHRDHDHPVERWMRWTLVAALAVLAVAALGDVFGQHPTTAEADAAAATVRVKSPDAIRGGLLFQSRIQVAAHAPIRRPTLFLGSGWLDNLTLNTVEPGPTKESSEAGGVALEFPRLEAGRTLTVYLQFQVNPTTVGRRSQDVVLRDGERRIAVVERTVTVFP
jgi:hypothetical protein